MARPPDGRGKLWWHFEADSGIEFGCCRALDVFVRPLLVTVIAGQDSRRDVAFELRFRV